MRAHAKVVRIDTPFVFPRADGRRPVDVRHAWYRALAQAEITDFRFHDLRHSTASYLAMNGASLVEIAEVLGHKTLSMVQRYAHLSEGHTRSVLERMTRAIFS
jgi:integrase